MPNLTFSPYKLPWYTIPVIMLIAAIGKNHTIDVNNGDTYYIFSLMKTGIILSIILFLNGLFYFLLRYKLKISRLIKIQLLMTISVFIILMFSGLFWRDWVTTDYSRFSIANDITFILIFLGVISQGLFVIVVGRNITNISKT